MPYYEFLWTDEIVGHLADHGIEPDDFEHVVCHPISKGLSRTSNLPAAWGYTLVVLHKFESICGLGTE